MDGFYDLVDRAVSHEHDAMSGEALTAYLQREELSELQRIQYVEKRSRVTPEQ